ncbi:transcription factor bHLH167-like [Euphorbia lathyris]|uniref:transcription factor bHLH167-like n=1 Tax=Euphorbia lathyris TaxID=212925 RepID=UPI003313AE9C
MEPPTINNRTERNIRERDRRMHMRNLLSILSSLLSVQSKVSLNNLVDEATSHIKKMKMRIDQLELRRTKAKQEYNNHPCSSSDSSGLPFLRISSSDSTGVEVNLITGFTKNFKLHEVIEVLQEEGAQVTSCSSTLKSDDHRFIYTIISQPMCSRIGIKTGKIAERLQDLVCS